MAYQQPLFVLSNDEMEVRIDRHTGRIFSIRNRASRLDLITTAVDSPPWRIEIEGEAQWLDRFSRFSLAEDPSAQHPSVDLRWELPQGLVFTSRMSLLPGLTGGLRITFAVENPTGLAIDKVEYPILTGIGPLVEGGGPAEDPDVEPACLTHSQGSGFLFRDPFRNFIPEPGPKQGLRYSPYPEGFNGSTMQFMAYHAAGRGGFYFATRDSGSAMKWFNFYKDHLPAGLTATMMHQAGHVAPGLDFSPGYEIEISCLVVGDWYEAADRYKAWAVQQKWTRQGELLDRPDRPRWLYEDTGITTFGINAAYDRAAWLDAIHKIARKPVLHILGPNWAQKKQDYYNHIPGGEPGDWLPARFSEENLSTIRKNGDFWIPFEFDLLCSYDGGSDAPVLESRQVIPLKSYSFDRYSFMFMCPGTAFWRKFHVERDTALVRDYQPDGIYYDITVNNVVMSCRSKNHDHNPGGGQEIVDAYARMYQETKDSMADAAGRRLPIGTESITELSLPYVDFYQARAEASPLSPFEADFWREWIIAGKAEKIPLFTYVYHEYGPVRMDGWAKLAKETGEAFYWVASRVLLWGGLFELNYEFTGLETLEGHYDDPTQHYYQYEPGQYKIDAERAAFVEEVAEARAGWANDYLAYGTMLRPPKLDVPPVTLDYFFYNAGMGMHSRNDSGEITVPGVVCSAWRCRRERAAVFFSNLLTEAQPVTVELDARSLGLPEGAAYQVYRVDRSGAEPLGSLDGQSAFTITLPPRRIIAIEVK